VFHSPDGGKTWVVFDTPIAHGPESAGIFSIAFRNSLDGVIAGGDYKHPDRNGPNLAFTHDGGKTWELSTIHPQAYFSAVAYDHKSDTDARRDTRRKMPAELKGEKGSADVGLHPRLLIVGQNFILDLHHPNDPKRLALKKKSGANWNAISANPEGGALLVGSKGTIGLIR